MLVNFSSPTPGRLMPKGREPSLPGDKYNWLTLVSEVPDADVKASARGWRVRCECGVEKSILLNNIRTGKTGSCGCLQQQKGNATTHGMRATSTYKTWAAMLQRCTNPNNKSYADYGGRGIGLDPEWLKFEVFLSDMGERPEGLSLDRQDNSGPYSRANCCWATRTQQNRNTRRNRLVAYNGKNISLAEAVEIAGLNYKRINARLNRDGWSIQRALGPDFSDPS